MQSNNTQFGQTRSLNPPNLPSLTATNVQQNQRNLGPQQAMNFAPNTTYIRNNTPHQTPHNGHQTNTAIGLALPTITRTRSHPGAPNSVAPTYIAPNTTRQINNNYPRSANNNNNNKSNNSDSVPYTISSIQEQSVHNGRKRLRGGFDNRRIPYQSPATKKQRIDPIPPPLYNEHHALQHQHHHHEFVARHHQVNMPNQREWRQSRQSAKFKMAMDILDQFKQNHGGKLPSLRAVMKMLKVGFPKAHEILDAYAAHIGVTKEKLMQDMTVRQEKKRSNETTQHKVVVHREVPVIAVVDSCDKKELISSEDDSVPNDVNRNLQRSILSILQCTQNGDSAGVYRHCLSLSSLVDSYEEYYSRLSVNDRLRLAQSYFLLSSMYLIRHRLDFAYCYVERALSTFRDCNGLAFAAGYTISICEDNMGDISREDIGHFWAQIVEVYILGGHILLGNGQYGSAKDMYCLAHNLAQYINIKSLSSQMTVSEALENLAVVSMYDNRVDESIKYTAKIIDILNSFTEIAPIKILNARAYYSCCLTLSKDCEQIKYGYNEYSAVIAEAIKQFGANDPRTIAFYCYFALHFIQINDFEKTHHHIDHILNCNKKRNLQIFEKNVLNDLFNDYLAKSKKNNHYLKKIREKHLEITKENRIDIIIKYAKINGIKKEILNEILKNNKYKNYTNLKPNKKQIQELNQLF